MMELISDHAVRVLDQEIDTLEIYPDHPDYVVIGTYSLVKSTEVGTAAQKDEDEVAETQGRASRIGSLRVLHINDIAQPNPERHSVHLARLDFPCAILDVRFCPTDCTLLGAATSIGELRFFRVLGVRREPHRHSESINIIPLGIAQVATDGDGDSTSTPLITQFSWIQLTGSSTPRLDDSGTSTYLLAVCDTTGQTKLVQVSIANYTPSEKIEDSPTSVKDLCVSTETIHKHLYDLEAWSVHYITISTQSDTLYQILLSGGDDSCLIASTYKVNLADASTDQLSLEAPPMKVYTDRRNHTAGVVSILPLHPIRYRNHDEAEDLVIPLLTGSYDQRIRLFLFNPSSLKFTLISELELEGGVWRIALLDTYSKFGTSGHQMQQMHTVLLVSAMYSGCYIIRLIHQLPEIDGEPGTWDWRIEARFTQPHESMVYACVARTITSDEMDDRTWQVVSTSFYDKRICVWKWIDRMRES